MHAWSGRVTNALSGEEATATTQDGERMKFTGHEREFAATGAADDLDYMHARWCNPVTGRFMAVDPLGGNPRRPQSWNRYAYALGNPMKYVDPEGLAPASQQGRNTFERAVDEVSLFLQAVINYFLDKNDKDDAAGISQESIDAAYAAEGFDPKMLPANRAKEAKTAVVVATATVAATAIVVGATAAEQAVIDRVLGVVMPSGRYIGRASGTNTRVREVTGGTVAAEKMFATLTRGRSAERVASYSGRMVRLSENVRIGYRPLSRSGPPTVDIFLGEVYVKLKYVD